MIPEGPNPISTCPILYTTPRSQRDSESPTLQSTPLGFPVLAPILSCTHEDFFIVLSQEGTHGFDPLPGQK